MQDQMAAGAFERAMNYGCDGPSKSCVLNTLVNNSFGRCLSRDRFTCVVNEMLIKVYFLCF